MQCACVIDSVQVGGNLLIFFSRFCRSFLLLLLLGSPFSPPFWVFFWESWRGQRRSEGSSAPSWCWVMTAHSFVSSPGSSWSSTLSPYTSSISRSLSHTLLFSMKTLFAGKAKKKKRHSAVSIKTHIFSCRWMWTKKIPTPPSTRSAPRNSPHTHTHTQKEVLKNKRTRLFLLWVSTSSPVFKYSEKKEIDKHDTREKIHLSVRLYSLRAVIVPPPSFQIYSLRMTCAVCNARQGFPNGKFLSFFF